jgi:hypothetical protein
MIRWNIAGTVALVIAVFGLALQAWGRSNQEALFKYAGGTEQVLKGCEGKLEVNESDMVFECDGKSISVPYNAVTQMEFLPQISKKIRKMKLHWAVKPPSSRGKHEGFFSVIYSTEGQTHAIILKARDETMRPYLAEIDLKTGRPIESRTD